MQYRRLGKSGIDASIVGLGTYVTGHGDDKESIKGIQTALDLGVTLIDTAPSYGWGHSEEVVGKAIQGRRDRVVIATKCGVWWADDRGSPNGSKDGKEVRISLRPDTIRIEVEDSLRRLGVDTIDLMQVHKPSIPPDETPIPETMDCLMDLKAQGKIRAIGVSNVSPGQLEQYQASGDLASDQFRYSMLSRQLEKDILPYCQQHNIATITYSSLEQGLLSGKFGPDYVFEDGDFRKDVGPWLPWFKPENRQRLSELFTSWSDLTEKHQCTISQLTIAWTAAQPGATHVLCGTRNVEQAVMNAGAGDVRLDADEALRMRSDVVGLGAPL